MAATAEAPLAGSGVAGERTLGSEELEYDSRYEGLESHMIGAKPKIRLSEEERLAREMTRRRQAEAERRVRIFDAKRRLIGVDKEFLDKQAAEDQEKRRQERFESRANDNMASKVDKQLKLMDIEGKRNRREMEKACKDYSLQHLNFESRREFDLNDPLSKRKGLPARVGDSDPRCGPSSMQQFSGEDLMKDERLKQQKQAMVNFIEQQKFERNFMYGADSGEAEEHARYVAEITALRNEMEENEANLRKELQRNQQAENLRQADEMSQRRMAETVENQQRNAAEIEYNLTGHFLNEAGERHRPDGRLRRDAFKGSSREERVAVGRQVQEQADSQREAKFKDKMEDQVFAMQAEQTRRQIVALERQKQAQRRLAAEANAAENKRLQVAQAAEQTRLQQLYTNCFTDEFHAQFNKDTR